MREVRTGTGASGAAGPDVKSLVLQSVDIVELIGQTVALKRAGSRYKGLCPFHQEKTPSFSVDPNRKYFHCFGCKAAGNAIDFVMKRDRVEFLDALRSLAEAHGIEMRRYRGGDGDGRAGERQQLLDANSAACMFFENLLKQGEQGAAAQRYLAERGFNEEAVKRFRIGVAPNAWDGLLRSPVGRKFPPQLLVTAGLLKARDNGSGFYDTFRNRLMFPIRDESGRIIAFGGRVMPGSEDPAKYLNSPETPLFSKSKCIFGLDLARQRVVETRTVAVVEGYTDVVMAHQYGVTNVVSVLGTALTESHVQILRRFADRIVLLFDADAAGDTAVNRAVELFLTQPVDIAIASLPDDVDPDEFLLAHGAEGFDKLLAEAPSVLPFMRRQFKRNWEAAAGDVMKQDAARKQFMAPFVAARAGRSIDNQRWGAAINILSKETGVPEAILHREYGAAAKAAVPRKPVMQAVRAQEPDAGEPNNTPRPPAGPLTAQDRAERQILGVLLGEPSRWDEVQKHLSPQEFTEQTRRRLAEVYWDHQRHEGEPVFSEFLTVLSGYPGLSELAVELIDELETVKEPEDLSRMLDGALGHLAEIRRRRGEQKLVADLRRSSDESLSEQAQDDLLRKLQDQARRPDLRRVGF